MKAISPPTLRDWILDGFELAILDSREEGEFGRRHLFWAVCCPLSRRETRVPALLPNKRARIVCTDAGGGEAQRLAAFLEEAGYGAVAVLDGGVQAWEDAGYVLFSGVNVPSKAFGEWVEHHYGTESVDPAELDRWLKSGRDMVLLDSRTFEEFQLRTLPGSRNVPGGELVYRIGDLAPDPQTLVVVHCAGRTRSIMGAESLRRAGIPNRVVALRNGTMGWELAGLSVERGRTARFAPGAPHSAGQALARAAAFAERSGVGVLDAAALAALEADPERTLYRLDVREPADYEAGHYPGSSNAPGGQLIQATDEWIAVRNCRIVLFDDGGTRSRMTAGWLRHMGYPEVFVFDLAGLRPDRLVTGPAPRPPLPAGLATTTPAVLAERLAREEERPLLLDLARSIDFRAGHIPGAAWCMRRDLPARVAGLAPATPLVLTSTDGVTAGLAAMDLPAERRAHVQVLAGGTKAWAAAGLPLVADRRQPPDADCQDFYLRPYDHNEGVDEAISRYLSWEIDLIRDLERDGTVGFRAP